MPLTLSRVSFKIEGNFPDRSRMRELGWEFFNELQRVAYGQYEESQDVGLRVHLERGSLIGSLEVFTGMDSFYAEVERKKSLRKAVDGLYGDGMEVAKSLRKNGPLHKELQNADEKKAISTAGHIAFIKRAFEETRNGQIFKREGIAKVMAILERQGPVPDYVKRYVEADFSGMHSADVQLDIELDPELTPKPKPKAPKRQLSPEEREDMVFDIICPHRGEDAQIKET